MNDPRGMRVVSEFSPASRHTTVRCVACNATMAFSDMQRMAHPREVQMAVDEFTLIHNRCPERPTKWKMPDLPPYVGLDGKGDL